MDANGYFLKIRKREKTNNGLTNLSISCDLVHLLGHWRRLPVAVDVPLGHDVLEPDEIAVLDVLDLALGPGGAVHLRGFVVPLLDQESVDICLLI